MRHGGVGEGRDSAGPQAARQESALLAAARPERETERRVPRAALRGSYRLSPKIRRKSVRLFRRGQDAGEHADPPPHPRAPYCPNVVLVSLLHKSAGLWPVTCNCCDL